MSNMSNIGIYMPTKCYLLNKFHNLLSNINTANYKQLFKGRQSNRQSLFHSLIISSSWLLCNHTSQLYADRYYEALPIKGLHAGSPVTSVLLWSKAPCFIVIPLMGWGVISKITSHFHFPLYYISLMHKSSILNYILFSTKSVLCQALYLKTTTVATSLTTITIAM